MKCGVMAAVYGGVQLVSSIYKGCESWTQMIPHESAVHSVRLSVCLRTFSCIRE